MKRRHWLASADPTRLLEHAWKATRDERKLRLAAVAAWLHLTESDRPAGFLDLIALACRVADGEATDAERAEGFAAGEQTVFGLPGGYPFLNWSSYQGAFRTFSTFGHLHSPRSKAHGREPQPFADLIRDIFDGLYLPNPFDPSWRTEAAVALARGMYESRDFAPMPVLADALDDAGCADADILAHCRGPGPHVRGCWVVDLVLGKG